MKMVIFSNGFIAENSSVTAMGNAATVANLCENEKESSNQNEENGNGKGSPPNLEESDLQER